MSVTTNGKDQCFDKPSDVNFFNVCYFIQELFNEESSLANNAIQLAFETFNTLISKLSISHLSKTEIESLSSVAKNLISMMRLNSYFQLHKYATLGMAMLKAILKNTPNRIKPCFFQLLNDALFLFGPVIPDKHKTFPLDDNVFNWVLNTVTFSDFCSNYYLRGTAITVLNRLPNHVFRSKEYSDQIIYAVMTWSELYVYGSCEDFNAEEMILDNYFLILEKFLRYEAMEETFECIIEQCEQLDVQKETHWFLNLLDNLRKIVKHNQVKTCEDQTSYATSTSRVSKVFQLFSNFITSDCMKKVLNYSSLSKIISYVLISMLEDFTCLAGNLPAQQTHLLINTIVIIKSLMTKLKRSFIIGDCKYPILYPLRIFFGADLNDLADKCDVMKLDLDIGVFPDLDAVTFPSEYTDESTNMLMLTPIFVNEKNVFVDESTLIINSLWNISNSKPDKLRVQKKLKNCKRDIILQNEILEWSKMNFFI